MKSLDLREIMRKAWQEAEGDPVEGYEDFRENLMDELQPVFESFYNFIVENKTL